MKLLVAIIAFALAGCSQPAKQPHHVDTSFWNTYNGAAPEAKGQTLGSPAAAPLNTPDAGGAAPAPAQGQSDVAAPSISQAGPAPSLNVQLDDAPRFDASQPKHLSPRTELQLRKMAPREDTPFEQPDGPPQRIQLAYASGPVGDIPANYTGGAIYGGDWCGPCLRLDARINLRATKRWTDEKTGRPFASLEGCWFAIVQIHDENDPLYPMLVQRGITQVPTIIFFESGKEVRRTETIRTAVNNVLTDADIDAAIDRSILRHPKCAKPGAQRFRAMETSPALATVFPSGVIAGDYAAPIQFAEPTGTMTVVELPSTTTYWSGPATSTCWTQSLVGDPVYAAPVYAAPSPGLTVGPATHSAQLNLFGFPLIGGSMGATW